MQGELEDTSRYDTRLVLTVTNELGTTDRLFPANSKSNKDDWLDSSNIPETLFFRFSFRCWHSSVLYWQVLRLWSIQPSEIVLLCHASWMFFWWWLDLSLSKVFLFQFFKSSTSKNQLPWLDVCFLCALGPSHRAEAWCVRAKNQGV